MKKTQKIHDFFMKTRGLKITPYIILTPMMMKKSLRAPQNMLIFAYQKHDLGGGELLEYEI